MSRTSRWVPVALVLALAAPAEAQLPEIPDEFEPLEEWVLDLPPEEEFAETLELVERLGRVLAIQVQLADEAEAAVVAVASPELVRRIQNRIVVPEEGQWKVVLVTSADGRLGVVAEVRFSPEGTPGVTLPERVARPDEKVESIHRAGAATLRKLPYRCGDEYIQVVLPAPRGIDQVPAWSVWMLARDRDGVMLGGHFRATVTDEESIVEEVSPLSSGCLDFESSESAPGESERLWLMNTLTATPLESHVFLSLHHDLPLMVGTWTGAWQITGGEVGFDSTWPELRDLSRR